MKVVLFDDRNWDKSDSYKVSLSSIDEQYDGNAMHSMYILMKVFEVLTRAYSYVKLAINRVSKNHIFVKVHSA